MTPRRLPPDLPFCPACGAKLTDTESARPQCPGCNRVAYRNPIVGVAAVVRDEEGRVLLGKRAAGPYAGLWCIPCGYVEWGEDIRDAVLRELREETGLEGRVGELLAAHSNFHNPASLTVGIWFEVDDVQGSLQPVDGEFSELKFFDPTAPPELAFPTDALVLAELATRRLQD